MKRLVACFSALALTAGPAIAAAPPPPSIWTGFYLGLNIGGVAGTSTGADTNGYSVYDWAASALGMPFGFSSPYRGGHASLSPQSGVLGGFQLGYNYQFAPNFVLGIETDFQGTSLAAAGSTYSLAGATDVEGITHLQNGVVDVKAGVGWLGTVRGRIGYLVTPSILLFGTGGLAYGNTYANVNSYGRHWHPGHEEGHPENPVTPTWNNIDAVRVGWTVGGGAEWAFLENWSAKAEALYFDLGSLTVRGQYSPLINPAAPYSIAIVNAAATSMNYQGVIARVGVNYRFDWLR